MRTTRARGGDLPRRGLLRDPAAADDAERALLWMGRQVGVRGHGPHLRELLRPGRRRAAHEAARGVARDRAAGSRARAPRRQRLPRRRRQPPPARPLRRARRRRGGAGARAGRRDPRRLCGRRRLDHRRARRGDGQGLLDAAALLRGRPRCDAAPAARVRPGRHRQPGQALPDAAPLRRVPGPYRSIPWRGWALQSVSESRTSCGPARRRSAAVDDLDLGGLNRMLEHEAGDLTCTVEAGLPLSALQAELAEHGQMLALDPSSDPTIGGCIAGDLHGPRSHRYGRMRDLLLGVTVVLGDGLVASSGGKVVKNVAGYDLGKLLCGSRGTLGIILPCQPPSAPAAGRFGDGRPVGRRAGEAQVLRRRRSCRARSTSRKGAGGDVRGRRGGGRGAGGARQGLVGGERAGPEVWDEVRLRPREPAVEPSALLRGSLQSSIQRASSATAIERELIDACTHCGFCLPTCPTYGPLGQMEADSPRGRMWLMRGLADGTMTPNSAVVEHIDRCLG